MNNFYNSQNGRDTMALVNKVTQTAVNGTLGLLEKQIEFARAGADRSLSRAASLPKFTSAEEVLKFQKEVGEAELAELRKAGEAYYELADNAGREFVGVAKEGRQLVEASFGEAAANAASILPNGKAAAFSDVVGNSLKTVNDLMQNGFDAAMQVARAGADTVVKGQQAVAEVQANGVAGAADGADKRRPAKK